MEPNTEQIFATQAIDDTREGISDDDNGVSSTEDEFSSESDDVDKSYELDEVLLERAREKAERRRLISQLNDSDFLNVKYTQDILKRFQKTEYVYPPSPQPRSVLTQEEIDDNEMMKRTYTSHFNEDMIDAFYVNERIPIAKDETLPQVKELVLANGFVSARQVQDIIASQSQAMPSTSVAIKGEFDKFLDEPDIEMGFFTQLQVVEMKHKEKRSEKCVNLDDSEYHQIDKEVLDVINQQQLLNSSLGCLSQKLSISRRAAEIFESSLSQSQHKDLDVMVAYRDDSSNDSDDEAEVKFTEEIEFDFLNGTEMDDLPETEDDDQVPPCNQEFCTVQSSHHSKASPAELKARKLAKMKLFYEEVEKMEESDSQAESHSMQDNIFGLNNLPSTSKVTTVPTVLPGFGFVSGKSVEIKNFDDIKARFELEDRITSSKLQKNFNLRSDATGSQADLAESPAPFKPYLKKIKVPSLLASPASLSSSSVKRCLNLVNRNDSLLTPETSRSMKLNRFSVPTPSFSPIVPSPAMPSTSGFVTASGKNTSAINSEKLKKLAAQFEEEDNRMLAEDMIDVDSPVKPVFKKLRLDFGVSASESSPFLMESFKRGIAQQSTPLVTRFRSTTNNPPAQEHSSPAPLCFIPEGKSLQYFEEIAQPSKKNFAKTCLIDKLNQSADDSNASLIDIEEFESIEKSILLQQQTMHQVAEDVKTERERALEDQRRSLTEKADIDRAPKAGAVYVKKSRKNRMKMREYVEQQQPKTLDRHSITFSNAVDYKFTMQNHYDEVVCRANTVGLSIADNARLIMNPQSKVGVKEISSSFLASPNGVDPKLVNERWIENAFKMIVLKLSHLENSFEKFNKYELLNPENVLLQMKYRYDREIDMTHRSAIKKLTERDDVACRRMVLMVVDIIDVPNIGYELQLSDGWYSIRASIDASLASAIESKKIVFGTKLVISCADLVGCDGSDPLELLDNVRLKIHANSTRRTTWDAKMGFCKNPTQIKVPLDSIRATGGIIGKIVVAMTHVYPTVYVDSTGPTKEFRSEKLQHRIEGKQEVLNFSIYEAVAHQVHEEESKEVKQRALEVKASKKKLEELSAEEICDLLDFETDEHEAVSIQKQLNAKLLEQVRSVRDERNVSVKERIIKKLGEKSNRPPHVVKVRVVDAVKTKETAIISCWSPSEDLTEILKEGKTIEILNAMAGPQTNEIQVTAGRSSAIRLAKDKVPEEKLQPFFRRETKMSDINSSFKPSHNEFDLAFVVIQVDPFNDKESQKVYVADEDMNIVCIFFWNGISSAAFDDVIKVGQFVYACNLKWRLVHAADKLPKAFVADDVTLFVIRPLKQRHQRRLDELRSSVGDINVFMNKCIDKLSELQLSTTTNKENRSDNLCLSNKSMNPSPSSNSINSSLRAMQSTPVLDSISRARAKRERRLGYLGKPTFNRSSFKNDS